MSLLKYKLNKSILEVTLSDPQSRNAFSPPMAEELASVLKEQKFQGLLLKSEGEVFCSGGQLKYYKNLATKDQGLEANQRIATVLTDLWSLPLPKACVVHGACYGGGIELLSSFDYIMATPSSLFGLWQRRIGLTFGWGGEERLLKRMSHQKIQQWLLEADIKTAYQAKALGLVDGVSLSDRAHETASRWLNHVIGWGMESLSEVQNNKGHQPQAFKNLWFGKAHRKTLNQF